MADRVHEIAGPDATDGGINRWYGSTAALALEGRRGYRRAQEG